MDDDDDSGGFFPPHGGDLAGAAVEEPLPDDVAPGDIYATAGGNRQAASLRFIWKDRRRVSVPYAYLPLIWWESAGVIVVEYPRLFSVRLEGKELEELYRRIADQRITWVREFDQHQAAAMAAAVTRMDILRSYPSREVGV